MARHGLLGLPWPTYPGGVCIPICCSFCYASLFQLELQPSSFLDTAWALQLIHFHRHGAMAHAVRTPCRLSRDMCIPLVVDAAVGAPERLGFLGYEHVAQVGTQLCLGLHF